MGEYTPQSRSEEILYDTIHSLEYTERPQSRIEELLLELKAVIEGGSGTTDYEDLEHKPSIGGVELSGDKSLSDLGAASEEAVAAKASQSDIAPTFSDATAYTAGDVVYHDGSLYRFTADHSTGAWDSADVEPVTVDDLVDGLKPVDSVTDGNMRPVTSNAVCDALALKADSPVDAVTDGNMNAVTSNAVADALALKADLPVDAVTNGEAKAVTSNAVYDAMHKSYTLAKQSGETLTQYLDRFYAGMDRSKLTTKSALIVNNFVYRINFIISGQIEFIMHAFTITSSTTVEKLYRYILKPSGSKKYNVDNTIAGVAGSSGVSSTYAVSDVSNAADFDTLTLYY